MRIHEFLSFTAARLSEALPAEFRRFDARRRFNLLQISYGNPRLHFEVWVQGDRHRVELGLHLEADRETNERLRTFLASRFLEVQAELGPQFELEQWTKSWSRAHEYVPYERLDEEFARTLVGRLARMIVVLQPMLEDGLQDAGTQVHREINRETT